MNDYFICSEYFVETLRVTLDRYGIYKARKALAKVLPGVKVYRGDEWWNA